MTIDDVKKFLDEHQTCVLATVHEDGSPQAATVGFSIQDGKIFIGTNNKSRKYNNLNKSSKIALVVGFEGSKTIQLEGVAQEVKAEDNQQMVENHYKKVPGAKKYANLEGQTYFLITPTWLRFTDYAAQDPIFESENLG